MRVVRVFRRSAKLLAVIALVASIALNLSMLTVSGVYATASAALSGIGVTTVAAREAVARRGAYENTRKIARKTARTVTRRMGRGAARNIGSAAGEAIPVIGIGVIVGGLALEVNDMCKTARDMAGLQAALDADDEPDLAQQTAKTAFDCKEMIREDLPGYTDLPSRESLWADIRESPAAAWNGARAYLPDLPDFSESHASGLARVTGRACLLLPCDGQEASPE